MKSIILDCISHAPDEKAISKCIPLENFIESIENDLTTIIAYSADEYNLLFEGEFNQIMAYLHSFGNYLEGIVQVLRTCDKIDQILRRKLTENTKICGSLSDFMRSLSTTQTPSHIKRTGWCRVKSKFASQLFTLIFEVYEISVFLETMTDIQTGTELMQTHHDRCIESHLIEFIASSRVKLFFSFFFIYFLLCGNNAINYFDSQISDAAINLLLTKYFTKIVFIEPKFIACVAHKPDFFQLVLNKFDGLLSVNTSQKVSSPTVQRAMFILS